MSEKTPLQNANNTLPKVIPSTVVKLSDLIYIFKLSFESILRVHIYFIQTHTIDDSKCRVYNANWSSSHEGSTERDNNDSWSDNWKALSPELQRAAWISISFVRPSLCIHIYILFNLYLHIGKGLYSILLNTPYCLHI